MGDFEERNNDDKEEALVFGSEESGDIRLLGCWMGWKQDVEKRLERARKAWWKVKSQLKDVEEDASASGGSVCGEWAVI